jgi:transcriptional regulator with XRE-family HTH domain
MTKTAKVNGDRIRVLRSKRGLSQKELAGKVKVDPGTVSRWERGEIDRVRHDVLGRVRSALGASEAEICGEGPLPESLSAQEGRQPKGQMNLSIDTACRNALSLVALRYGVTRQQIVEAAPLLFYIVAEQSLQHRRNRLAALRDASYAVFDAAPAHLPPYWPVDEEALKAEQESINARDLFGTRVGETVGEPETESWDPARENPFSVFLTAALTAINPSAEPVSWEDRWEPAYRICTEEIAAILGNDDEATNAILSGAAALHEMPPEIRKSGPAELAEWARSESRRSRSTTLSAEELGL